VEVNKTEDGEEEWNKSTLIFRIESDADALLNSSIDFDILFVFSLIFQSHQLQRRPMFVQNIKKFNYFSTNLSII
jgi:hypothetical protein